MKKASQGIFALSILSVFIFPNIIFAANFGVRPAFPRADNPRTDSIFIQTINPGDSVEEGVKVINSTGETKEVILYARDSVRSSGGGFACKQLSEESTSVGEWINFDISNLEEDTLNVRAGQINDTLEISIPSGSEIIIPFKISPPVGTSVGEHNGCILIQEIKQTASNEGVSLSLRSGIRVAVSIPGQISRKLIFNSFEIEKKNKSIYLKPSVKNTGNVSLDTNTEVKVSHFFGLPHKTFGGQFPVFRDEIYDFSFELKKPFWGGLYSAKAVFSYDENETAGIGVFSGKKLSQVESGRIWFFSTPTLLGLIIEIIVLFTLLFIFSIWRLNKKKQKWIKKWIEYTILPGDTLEGVSRKNKVHWEIIAEVNHIKPPFMLKEGQVIKVPPERKTSQNKG
jgi:hypothetical protein